MIEVSHLTKIYGDHLAVSDLSFTIKKGHIYGFLGPNGAGKSTTMNIITGCLAATAGEVRIGGFDIFEQPKQAKKLIGYLPEMPPLYQDQTVTEYLRFVAEAKGLKGQAIEDEIIKVISEANIEDVEYRLIKHLSKGYRQRVGIAQALIGNPEVIILDEPTVGLDPAQIIEIRDFIKSLGKTHTVILSSHILPEVQSICDEVLIIHKGKLIAFDKIENLGKHMSTGNRVELSTDAAEKKVTSLLKSLPDVKSVRTVSSKNGECDLTLSVGEANPKDVCKEIVSVLSKEGIVLTKINPVTVSLEDVFIDLTSDQPEKEESEAKAAKKPGRKEKKA